MQKKYKVGLIGFSIGGHVFHAPFIDWNTDLELYKVTARREEQRRMLAERYPYALAVQSAEEILQDPAVDLVVVATSNDVHYSLAKAALEAGKHVVVEKPFTNTTAEADELIALAREKQLLLSVHHNVRFHSDYRTVQKVVAEGRLGRLVNVEVRYDRFRNQLRPGAWREKNLPGSGIHYDLGAHLIDQSLQLFGRPEAVFADLRIQRDHAEAVDDFEILLYYPRLKVSLKGQMLAKIPTPRYMLFGTKGCFVKPGVDPQEALLRQGVRPDTVADWGKEPEHMYGTLAILENGADVEERIPSEVGGMQAYYQNIAEVLQGKSSLAVKAEQARDVIRILEASEQSCAEKRVVSLKNELIS